METNDKWKRVAKSLIDPMTLIPIIIGVLFAFFTFITTNDFLKTLFTVVSAVGLGIGINYFSFYYKQEKEKKILYFKAEHTVRSLDLVIKSILRRTDYNSSDNRNTIDSLLNTIDYWKDYYLKADISQIEKLKKLREEIASETDENDKSQMENKLFNMEHDVSTGGLTSYIPLSGGTHQ